MDAPDPFLDPAFVTRVQKLMAMLASEQPGEADVARRKLMEHLAHHRLSLTDIAIRLGDRGPKPSFVQGAREMSLERQLSIARDAKHQADYEAAQARSRFDEQQLLLQRASFDVGRLLKGRSKIRQNLAIAWSVAAIGCGLAAAQYFPAAHAPVEQTTRSAMVARPAESTDPNAMLRVAPGERVGVVLVQDLAVRLTPYDNAGVRAFLNQGMRVVIQQETRVGPQSWLLIRTITGSGWVRAGDVLH